MATYDLTGFRITPYTTAIDSGIFFESRASANPKKWRDAHTAQMEIS